MRHSCSWVLFWITSISAPTPSCSFHFALSYGYCHTKRIAFRLSSNNNQKQTPPSTFATTTTLGASEGLEQEEASKLHQKSFPTSLLEARLDGEIVRGREKALAPKATNSRRKWIHHALFCAAGCNGFVSPETTKAACLPGDLSKECIGVYKVPIDDAVLPYVGTPEALQKFAPDLKYVPPVQKPSSFSSAIESLEAQRKAADDIQTVVSAGRLEEAGIKVLNLMPKVTTSGKLVVQTISDRLDVNKSTIDEIRLTKLEDQYNMVIGLWGECDVTIGQGLRGEMGVSAVAQLQILSSLRDATAALDDFLATVASLSK